MQGDVEVWHKNFLSDEGTGVNIYELLKNLNELIYKDKQDTIEYFQSMLSQRLAGEHENYEVIYQYEMKGAMSVLKKKISELEYQNKLLNANYKSSEQGVKQEFLEKLALAEVKANDALDQLGAKDEEIAALKKEITSLRKRLQEAYAEKDKLLSEVDSQIHEARMEKEFSKGSSEELKQARDEARRLEEEIRDLKYSLSKKEKEAQESEAGYRRQVETLKAQFSPNSSAQDLARQKAEYEKLIDQKEQQRLRQKNEWAEVPLFNR